MRISIPQDMFLLAGILFCGARRDALIGNLAICLISFCHELIFAHDSGWCEDKDDILE
jgi:hypothetical protein